MVWLNSLPVIFAGPGIQVSGGFVSQDDSGLAGKGARDRDALLLTAGEIVWQAVQLLLQTQQPHHLHDEVPVRPAVIQGNGENDVLPDAEDRYQIIVLEYKTDLFAAENGGLLAVQAGKLCAADPDAALSGRIQAAQHV